MKNENRAKKESWKMRAKLRWKDKKGEENEGWRIRNEEKRTKDIF